MPFDPDELANGMMRWLENGRKPKPATPDAKPLPESEYGFVNPEPDLPNHYDPNVIYQNPEPSPPPADMPGSGLSTEELQEQIKALQDQLKALQGDGGAQFIPPGPGRDAPELTPDERRKKDWEMFDKWRQGGDGVPQYLRPRRPRPVPMPHYPNDRIGPDDAFEYPQPVPMPTYPRNDRPYIPHPDDKDIIADMPSWGPYKRAPQEKPRWKNLPYIREEDGQQEKPIYELLNGTSSPVKGLNK